MPKNKKNRKKPEKAEKNSKKAGKAQNFKIGKKAQIFFFGHLVQDCSKQTLVYMSIFFIEAIKKPGIKILSLLITYPSNFRKVVEPLAIVLKLKTI